MPLRLSLLLTRLVVPGVPDLCGGWAAADALGRALEARGLEVTRGVGSSHFRCDLTVRLKGEADHRVGVLLDTSESYATMGALERWVERPGLLARAGWSPVIVLGKDVLENVDAVAARIEKLASPSTADTTTS